MSSSPPRSAANWENWSRAASKSSAISAAIRSGLGKLAESSRLWSFSQKISKLTLSRSRRSSNEGLEAFGLFAHVAILWVITGDEVI